MFPGKIAQRLLGRFTNAARTYSQEGEDRILARIFEGIDTGFYVDVGAHHPTRFSNTYLFYLKGWRGINIDATPGSMKPFAKQRPRDVNLETPVGVNPQELTYFMFNEPALNTFDPKLAAERVALGVGYQIDNTLQLTATRLDQILATNLPSNTRIDFLTVDVEGLDFDVLQSNNWDRFRPAIVLVEDLENAKGINLNSEIAQYMRGNGYTPIAKTLNTVFFNNDRQSFPYRCR